MSLSDKGPIHETLDYTIRIGSTPAFFTFPYIMKTYYIVLIKS